MDNYSKEIQKFNRSIEDRLQSDIWTAKMASNTTRLARKKSSRNNGLLTAAAALLLATGFGLYLNGLNSEPEFTYLSTEQQINEFFQIRDQHLDLLASGLVFED